MEASFILLKQLITMFIFMGVGFALFKGKLVTAKGSGELSNLLLYIILPAVIINSYQIGRTGERMHALWLSFAISGALLVISMIISMLIYGKRYPLGNIGVAFSNCGFMGIPLVRAVMGDEAVFYCSAFVAILLILQWTYGVYIMTGDKSAVSLKKIVKNPVVIATVIGVVLFLIQVPLPGVVSTALTSIGALNGPVAMIILGIYLAQTKIGEIFKSKLVYLSCVIRLALIPIVSLLFLMLLPESLRDMKLTLIISASAPIGANVAIFAQMVGLSYTNAVRYVCLSTILSIVSMPLILMLAQVML